jgi:hypothetical protein
VSSDAVEELELMLRSRSAELTAPHSDECLLCFVARMLNSFGCDNTLRWAVHYRDVRAPRATGLETRLGQMGGYCDCEIFLNGYAHVAASDDEVVPARIPPCEGVERFSTKPCGHWQRLQRW